MIVAGLDGGATKTVCVIGDDEGRVLGLGFAGPLNYHVVGLTVARRNIMVSFQRALSRAGLKGGDVDVGCFGLGGLATKYDYEVLFKAVASLNLVKEPIIVGDEVVAYYATTYGEPGVAVVAGTGSIAYGRNREGLEVRVGGWGWLIGDEGSAFDIARKAMNAASRAYESRGPSTTLTYLLSRRFRVSDFRDLISRIYGRGRAVSVTLASLAPLVDGAARRGDGVAREILNEAGRELASLAIVTVRKLGLAGGRVIIGGVGGVFRSRFVWNSFRRAIFSEGGLRATLRGPLYGPYPALGGMVMALRRRSAYKEGVAERYFESLTKYLRGK